MDLDQTQAIYDLTEEEEEEQVESERDVKKEVAYLKVFSQQGFKETIFPVFKGDNFIGRDGKCSITIPIKALSKKHACIEVQRDLHLIHDCESKNKTKKGKSFLKPTIRYELRHGDMLTFGDVKCQFLVEADKEEDDNDETGSETGSESVLPEVNTEEEQNSDEAPSAVIENVTEIPREEVEARQPSGLSKEEEEEAYAADTDYETDEEKPLATAPIIPVVYSSEEECETAARYKIASPSMDKNPGETLAYGLGSLDGVFRNRESSGSAASYSEKKASVPPTLILSPESDIQSDGKGDRSSSDNNQSSFYKPPEPGVSGMHPFCVPTLLYGSESDDGSPQKRPRNLQARGPDVEDPTCAPTLLYGSESEDGSPVKRPSRGGAPSMALVLDESDFNVGEDNKAHNETNGSGVDVEEQVAAKVDSTDDEDQKSNDKKNRDSDMYGEDSATQPYAADTKKGDGIPVRIESTDQNAFDTNAPRNEPDMEATQAYFFEVADDEDDKVERRDSEGSDSQPLPISLSVVEDENNMGPTIAYDFDETQAYNVMEKDDSAGNEQVKMQPSDLQATQAYGLGTSDDETDDNDERDNEEDIHQEKISKPSELLVARNRIKQDNRTKKQPMTSDSLEATQAYGARNKTDETDDEHAVDQNEGSEEVRQLDRDQDGLQKIPLSRKDDLDFDKENTKTELTFLKPLSRKEDHTKMVCGLEETQAYDGESIDSGAIEATQAYGLEEPSVEEVKEAEIIAKATTVDKGRGVKVNETPAPRSRRAKRMKEAEVEPVSVLETPLNKLSTGTDEPEIEPSVVKETPSVGRRGRGRRKKEVAVAGISQVVELSEETGSLESEPSTPAKQRGRGKGRGKKKQAPSVTDEEAVVTGVKGPEDPYVFDEVQKPTLARGKGRGKGRGKKAQTAGEFLVEVVEQHTVEERPEFLQNLEEATPARGRGRGKGKGKKTKTPAAKEKVASDKPVPAEDEQHQTESPVIVEPSEKLPQGRQRRATSTGTEFESSEDLSGSLSNEGSINKGSRARKGRGRPKEVEETPAKKSRPGKEPYVTHSPSLHQEKQADESSPRVIFTGLVDKKVEKVVTNLGGQLMSDIHNCTHLVTNKVRRTVKFLCGLSRGVVIVQPSWLEACKKAKSFVDTSPFLVKDRDAEEQFKFDLQRSHDTASRQGLLEGYKVHVTKRVKPEPSQMRDIIQSAKGEFLSSMPRMNDNKVFVISCMEDRSVCKKPLEAGIPVVSAEIVLTGILRQELDFEEHKLFAEDFNEASQETPNGQSKTRKKRQEPSEDSASSPAIEPKTPLATKRRKR